MTTTRLVVPKEVVIDVFAALARTKGDIHYPSDESLDGHISVPSPYRSELQGYWNNVGNSLFHFLGVSLSGWQIFTDNKHTKITVCTESR